jgi:hypothetical protein
MHCGFLSREIFGALGFTMVTPPGAPMLAHPVGLDGVFQAYCPPYFPSMDAAVDAVLTPLLRETRRVPSQPPPHRISDDAHRAGAVEISAEGIACTKAICNYIHETYGRFPGSLDAMHLMWFMQAHHIDTEYYDRFFRPGAYGPTHRDHLATWHP